MEVHVLTTGRVRPKQGERGPRRYVDRGWSETTLPVNVVVVEHPEGVCLFDAGQTASAAEPGYFAGWYPFFRLARFELGPDDEAAPQLAGLGLTPEDVRWVVLSHLHTDHVGGLAPFAHADVVVVRKEWKRASGLGGRLRGYLPQRWPAGLVPRLVDLDGPPLGPFPATHDLAGDGSMLLVPTPGHTPSHAGLVVRDGPRTFLLAGDAELPPPVMAWCAADGAIVLAAHDDGAARLLERQPA
jgi:glyoxylase-like metal-dependent hydrolase (beta-lactamase superfamily II)